MIYQGTTKVNGPTIDCLVLEDGSVYGPDSLRFHQSHDTMPGKRSAAQVKAGKAQGKSSSDVYKAFATSSIVAPANQFREKNGLGSWQEGRWSGVRRSARGPPQ